MTASSTGAACKLRAVTRRSTATQDVFGSHRGPPCAAAGDTCEDRFYGDALRELGGVLGDGDFVAAALLRYETALEKDPTNWRALTARAKAELDLVRAGRRLFARCRRRTHTHTPYLVALARAIRATGTGATWAPQPRYRAADDAAGVAAAQAAVALVRRASELVDDKGTKADVLGRFALLVVEHAEGQDRILEAVLQAADEVAHAALQGTAATAPSRSATVEALILGRPKRTATAVSQSTAQTWTRTRRAALPSSPAPTACRSTSWTTTTTTTMRPTATTASRKSTLRPSGGSKTVR